MLGTWHPGEERDLRALGESIFRPMGSRNWMDGDGVAILGPTQVGDPTRRSPSRNGVHVTE